MLGHKLWQHFSRRFDTWVTISSTFQECTANRLLDHGRLHEGVNAVDFDSVVAALAAVRPEVVINCIGVVKQAPARHESRVNLAINSLFPQRLATCCQAIGARLIHISTDCVFSGRKGMYVEDDLADADDLYGRTKFLGEVTGPGCLTLRTSIIGRELKTSRGLLEWFLNHRGGKVPGYTQAIYTGFTTLALAEILAMLIEQFPRSTGLYHVSSDPITKYKLLCLLRDGLNVPIEIEPSDEVRIDRSLNSAKFRAATGFASPSWPAMIRGLAADTTPYEIWRREHHA